MLKVPNHHNPRVVDLTENVSVHTDISQENHAALRSGFAGYPANPRWNINKFQAWRTGRQLRAALAQGLMVVRSTDSMLVPTTAQDEEVEEKPPSTAARQLKGKRQKETVFSSQGFTVVLAVASL
jgi:hypothetical protein